MRGFLFPSRPLGRCGASELFRVNRLVFLKNTKLLSLGVHGYYLYINAKGHISLCYRTTSVSTTIQVHQLVVIESYGIPGSISRPGPYRKHNKSIQVQSVMGYKVPCERTRHE